MNIRNLPSVLAALAFALLCGAGITPIQAQTGSPTTSLWFNQPAKSFHEACVLGNGRIGAMVFGGVDGERIILNESSVWSGSPEDNDRAGAYQVLPEIRRLLAEGKNPEAAALVMKNFTCKGAGSGAANGANLPFGGGGDRLPERRRSLRTDTFRQCPR